MDPSGPSQPSQRTAYETEGNPAETNPGEQRRAAQKDDFQQQHRRDDFLTEDRKPGTKQHSSTEDAVPSSLGFGERGARVRGEETKGRSEEDVGRHRELEGEQMRAPGEGDVADAVERKPGAGPKEPDFASDLDRKKQEQAGLREEMKAARQSGMISDEAGIGRGTESLRDV
ncbi:uncharacterized protein B0I36DRAFT_324381 [Microdochium trichocladiopsis]|uniref:Uncharacterized protein n=1 Tax=Microdochium trichocladiopsis TaxID=1682393 RepID=A0A9P8Y9Y5_9PEZI|nr:uncharacterized protein B0I36DRAFT_324381 [Microdochium trichocladiopsis]KAH7031656.1 hypothetical protein B0I36DRAFT_324381 [Microdochium trichocladiopsis]